LNRLSVVIITLDEADDLPRCLRSVEWADEIVVVDSGSTDGTLELCRDHPKVRLVEQAFLGYGPQKRFAVAQAGHDWILSLDADEVVTPALAGEIQSFLAADTAPLAGATLSRRMVFLGRAFRHGRDARQRILRLFDRRQGEFTDDAVHEKVVVRGTTRELAGDLLHYSYRDLSDYFDKFNRYTTLMAEKMDAQGRRVGVPGIVLRPPWAFFQYYILRGNWLNGLPGFVYALLSALYKTVKYIKLYERQNTRG
jgi:glycosyltransferase involved in cell wall biosynthesis